MPALTIPKRAPKRSRVFLSAEIDCGGGPSPAHIRDISRSGALVEGDDAPEPGSAVRLTCGDTIVDGRVAWADRGWFGVEFDTPLLRASLVDPSGTKLKVSAPRTYRAADALD
jgi:hypothetical protein